MRTGWIGVKGQGGYSELIRKMRGVLLSVILLLMLLLLPRITVAETAAKIDAAIAGTDAVNVSLSGPSQAQTWFEENDPAIAYTGTWNS
ncbi:MAG TPA: hypothetical protein VFF47_09500, partial [Nitrospirota bacterium]|nr:hypothetical protein [Nitrospirota bacterium]